MVEAVASRWRTWLARAGALACLLCAACALSACHRAPAEAQVRAAIDAGAAAARANDAAGVLAVVGDDFVGNDGELDRRALQRLLAMRAFRQDHTGVLTGPVAFERHGDRIVAKFNLVLTGGGAGDWLPAQAAIYAMATAWRREGRKWVCYAATWTRTT